MVSKYSDSNLSMLIQISKKLHEKSGNYNNIFPKYNSMEICTPYLMREKIKLISNSGIIENHVHLISY